MDNHAWLESELSRQLRPVRAPASLRFERALAPSHGFPRLAVWPAVALLLFVASATLAWQFASSRPRLRQMAQMTAGAAPVADFWSDDPVRIRDWVKAKGNMDLDLPAEPSGSRRMVGVRLIRAHGTLVAAVSYKRGVFEIAASSQGACHVCHL